MSDAKLARLFPDCPREALFAGDEPWPALDGCLAILFASRSGSTFLSREIERRFAVGQINESLNPPQLQSRAQRAGLTSPGAALRHTVQSLGEGGWFAFKAGAATMIVGERLGFVPSYLPRMCFVILFRRDLVAQAVSAAKANFTGRFHSTQAEERKATQADYDRATILKKMTTMLKAMQAHDARARTAGRPWRKLFYEDFAKGDFASVEIACDALGLPRRPQIETGEHRTLTKIGDDVNEAWCERFRAESDERARRILERYEQLLSA